MSAGLAAGAGGQSAAYTRWAWRRAQSRDHQRTPPAGSGARRRRRCRAAGTAAAAPPCRAARTPAWRASGHIAQGMHASHCMRARSTLRRHGSRCSTRCSAQSRALSTDVHARQQPWRAPQLGRSWCMARKRHCSSEPPPQSRVPGRAGAPSCAWRPVQPGCCRAARAAGQAGGDGCQGGAAAAAQTALSPCRGSNYGCMPLQASEQAERCHTSRASPSTQAQRH